MSTEKAKEDPLLSVKATENSTASSRAERPQLSSAMTPAELNRLVEWNRTRCHSRDCEEEAVAIYTKPQPNAHGGVSLYRYQRCDSHAVTNAERIPLDVRTRE